MGRPRQVAGGRPVVVASRFSEEEARKIDAVRGPLNRAEWLRWVALTALKAPEDTPPTT
jgi:hypothetical protein